MRHRPRLSQCLILITLLLAACANVVDNASSSKQTVTPGTENPTPTAKATVVVEAEGQPSAMPEIPFPGDGPWEVEFYTADEVTLRGTLFGQGSKAVILAHMYLGDQESWHEFSQTLAGQGYRALAFDFRGYGESDGKRSVVDTPDDLAAAVTFLREHNAGQIALVGAGMGGTASIQVAADDGNMAGLAVISSPRSFEGLEVSDSTLYDLSLPSLWLGARNDMTHNVEEMYNQAGGNDKDLWIYEGSSLHGTFIFEGADGPDLERRLLEFVVRVLGS